MRARPGWVAGLALVLSAGPAAAKEPTPLKDSNAGDAAALAGKIDRLVAKRWADAKVEPAPAADDAEFVRRAYLDLAGRIPSVEEVRSFLDDKSPDKRTRLVDRILGGP